MKKCPNCGAQMNDDCLFCTDCGSKIPENNVCPNCGGAINEGDIFCQNCGKRIVANGTSKKNMALPIAIVGGILLLALLGGGGWWYLSFSKSKMAAEEITESNNIANGKSDVEEVETPVVYSTSSTLTFADKQSVAMHLANKTFQSSDGFTIRFDGDLKMYSEGDYAGVASVSTCNATSALIRYGGGQYPEGKFMVQIAGNKLRLISIADGSVFYQR